MAFIDSPYFLLIRLLLADLGDKLRSHGLIQQRRSNMGVHETVLHEFVQPLFLSVEERPGNHPPIHLIRSLLGLCRYRCGDGRLLTEYWKQRTSMAAGHSRFLLGGRLRLPKRLRPPSHLQTLQLLPGYGLLWRITHTCRTSVLPTPPGNQQQGNDGNHSQFPIHFCHGSDLLSLGRKSCADKPEAGRV